MVHDEALGATEQEVRDRASEVVPEVVIPFGCLATSAGLSDHGAPQLSPSLAVVDRLEPAGSHAPYFRECDLFQAVMTLPLRRPRRPTGRPFFDAHSRTSEVVGAPLLLLMIPSFSATS